MSTRDRGAFRFRGRGRDINAANETVLSDGYVPIACCAEGSGDPYFIRIQDQQPGPVYRIYHDSVHDENYDRGQAIVRVLDSYEELLMYLEES